MQPWRACARVVQPTSLATAAATAAVGACASARGAQRGACTHLSCGHGDDDAPAVGNAAIVADELAAIHDTHDSTDDGTHGGIDGCAGTHGGIDGCASD